MSPSNPILVTGAAGRIGGVGGAVVETLRQRDLPVRALVRSDDERAAGLRAIGAEVVVGDLTRAGDVARALAGCQRLYFGMSVSAPYLEATVTATAVARARGDLGSARLEGLGELPRWLVGAVPGRRTRAGLRRRLATALNSKNLE